MRRSGRRRPFPCVLAGTLALLALAGGCATTSSAGPEFERPDPARPGVPTPPSPMMTPPGY